MTISAPFKLGLAAFATAGLLDVLQLFALNSSAPAPVGVILLAAGLGLLSMIGAAVAWSGSRAGLLTAVAARVVATALGLPAFGLGAPLWVCVIIALSIVLSVVGLFLTAGTLRRRSVQAARS
ncbi:hypothetical protein [Actinoplanes friuliensis]|uniref:Uncharacterized protein n=1 Tax=Actinoplanes friuliensis DSM 7358 TaxID=1246995 RepID=U5W350_9ACTN|nr:hypothetical protein [Actinoplanes friuliensis]AGZ43633.1 hypothetical protein AFR_26860 [Actinoplanes friuliensis DSM 7358]